MSTENQERTRRLIEAADAEIERRSKLTKAQLLDEMLDPVNFQRTF